MPTEAKSQKKEFHSVKRVIGTCGDGHETEFDMAPMIAHVGSVTGEQCTKPSITGSGVCGKYLKVTKVFGG